MRQTKWPRKCERWRGDMVMRIGCNRCGKSWVADNVDDVIAADETGVVCLNCGSIRTCAAYHLAERCRGCLKLHFGHERWGRECSRRCKLIYEWSQVVYLRRLMVPDAPWRGYS